MALPTKVVGVYWTRWNPQIRLASVPQAYNLLYLFAATKAGSEGGISWGQNDVAADIKTCRGRGQRIILSTGGAGQGIRFGDRAASTRFVDSVVRINTELGGTLTAPAIDGVDFNTFEADATPNTPEYVWIGLELKRRFGQAFAITSPPAPWSNVDRVFCKEMLAKGAMDYAAPQFYDGPGLAEPAYIVQRTAEWVRDVAGGDASKIVVGFGMENAPNYSTIDQITSAYQQIKTAHPTIRGAFLWQHKTDADRAWAFANRAAPLVGATSSPTPIPPVVAPVLPDTRPKVTIGTANYPLSGADIARDTDNLVMYTTSPTPTNQWGTEVVIADGGVIQVLDRQASGSTSGTVIPAGAVVLSGHGAARDWLLTNARAGVTGVIIPGVVTTLGLPLLKRGTTDKEGTKTLQGLLVARGFAPANTIRADGTVDGGFGSGTETAVGKFQTTNKLTGTQGVVDDATWRKLLRL